MSSEDLNKDDDLFETGSPVTPGGAGGLESESKGSEKPHEPLSVEEFKSKSNENYYIPDIIGDDIPDGYQRIVDNVRDKYRRLPIVDFNKVSTQLAELPVGSAPNASLQTLNMEFQKIQASKDRFSTIYTNVLKNYFIKKSLVSLLQDSWAKWATDTSADKRKADALFRTTDFITDFVLVEALFRACNVAIKNLDSEHESLSRRITIIQLQLKINDSGNTGFEYSDNFEDADAEGVTEGAANASEGIDASENDF